MKNVQMKSAVNMILLLSWTQIKKKKSVNVEVDPVFPQLFVTVFPSHNYCTVAFGNKRNRKDMGRYLIFK